MVSSEKELQERIEELEGHLRAIAGELTFIDEDELTKAEKRMLRHVREALGDPNV